ncbi:hypothetical protein RFI_09349 [Reticulomyxa filosa]|uniref:Uncharacterized protein n=1 Tax=Reticulomyxa filosa TaxID=46433 RepID=X6NR02_RETFI|nr:hypothetical protein RFI_09349 [Reticulomyxa filosa]|eukprot:ETO27782.1 hypothetical protein RFI_09349 [Reticulomyxa filosa]
MDEQENSTPENSYSNQDKEDRYNVQRRESTSMSQSDFADRSKENAKPLNNDNNSNNDNNNNSDKNKTLTLYTLNPSSEKITSLEERNAVRTKTLSLQKQSADKTKKTGNATVHFSGEESTPPPPFINFKKTTSNHRSKKEEANAYKQQHSDHNREKDKRESIEAYQANGVVLAHSDENNAGENLHTRQSSGESELDDKTPHHYAHDMPSDIIYGDESVLVTIFEKLIYGTKKTPVFGYLLIVFFCLFVLFVSFFDIFHFEHILLLLHSPLVFFVIFEKQFWFERFFCDYNILLPFFLKKKKVKIHLNQANSVTYIIFRK